MKIEKELQTKEAKELYQALAVLNTPKAIESFLRDLCTLKEIEDMIERFQIAKRIYKKVSYRQIAQETKSSTATITRVAHWLHHGMGGYVRILSMKNT